MLNDELIGAYLDGELPPARRTMVERFLKMDKGAAARLERMRSADAMIRRAMPSTRVAEADPLARLIMAEPEERSQRRAWGRQAAAMAAACVMGVFFGRFFAAFEAGSATEDPIPTSPQVAERLDSLATGERAPLGSREIEIALSLRTDTGDVCRQYRIEGTDRVGVDALACRRDGRWRTIAQSQSQGAREGEYSVAGEDGAIDTAIAGLGPARVIEAQQERALIASGW